MLVASVDKINNQLILCHPIVCHPYITIKINNLHNDMWKMKKVWENFVLKINNGSSSSILDGFKS
jgi:hypothetical protein